jgi:hypothetical protein
MIDSWNVSDIQPDKVFRDIADQQLGPILEVSWLLLWGLGFCNDITQHWAGVVPVTGAAAWAYPGGEPATALGLGLCRVKPGHQAVVVPVAGAGLGMVLDVSWLLVQRLGSA